MSGPEFLAPLAEEPRRAVPDLSTLPPPEGPPSEARRIERPSPLTGIANAWFVIVAVAFFAVQEFSEVEIGDFDVMTVALVAIAVLAVLGLIAFLIGLVQWRTTTFVVDHEFRIEHRLIYESITRIDFTKVQSVDVFRPLVARLLGLAEVRIDVGSGAPQSLRFLKSERADSLRDYLLARMEQDHAQQLPVAADFETVAAPAAPPVQQQVVYQAQPSNILLGAFLSMGPASFILLVLLLGSALVLREDLPLAIWIAGIAAIWQIPKELLTNWGFSITRTDKGLRIQRGLFTKIQMTLRPNRVQAVTVTQTLLQRLVGIYKVRITVLGNATLGDDATDNIDVLTPFGKWGEVRHVISLVWPNVDPDAFVWMPQSARGKRLSLLADHWLHVGNQMFAARSQLLSHSISMVPYARIQGLSMHQGPLQRLLGLGEINAELVDGPVTIRARHLESLAAREMFVDVLERSRLARGNAEAEPANAPALAAPIVPGPWAPPEHWAPPAPPLSEQEHQR